MQTTAKSERYMWLMVALGAVCAGGAAIAVVRSRPDVYFLLLSALTIVVGSRTIIQIPRFRSHISVSDTFIFLTLLLWGGPCAILLATVEAGVSAWRFCNRRLTVFFNAALLAISTTTVYLVLNVFGLYTDGQLHGRGDDRQGFLILLSLVALTQFLVNTSLASLYDKLKSGLDLWETWKSKYLWSFFSYFIGAAAAGLIVQIAETMGWAIILAAGPVIFFVFLSYRMYMKNVEISVQQAEQAEQYARILEAQSDALRESEERFRSAFDNAPIGIGLVSGTGKWLKVNRALSEILGYSEEEFLSADFQSMMLPEDLGPTLIKVHDLLSGKSADCQMEQRYIHKSGHTVWTSWSVSTATDLKLKQANLIFQVQDITDKKRAEEQLQHDATHDALTGLPNRAFFMARLSEALAKSRAMTGYKVTVLFIDLDRFKYVNDSLGHLIGDELLKVIALRLRDCMRPSDLVARLGGDEFTILVQGRFDVSEVARIAERIQQKFGVAFDLFGHEVYSSASIGILHASDKHITSEDVMRDADTAMYQAKRAGKARHEVFDEDMHNAAKEILRLETDLRRAVEREEIQVWYQPIYSLATGEIECFESLARWEHPDLGRIKPAKFIPLAEEIGVIDKLCAQVMRRACQEIGSLHRGSGRRYAFSLNLSCKQFGQKTLVQDLESILDETGFSGENLRLEITESVFFEHHDRAVAMLNQLRDDGIHIDIDDFGTGYSNLGYLMRLPVSTLKIDRSFIAMIDENGQNDHIVRAIITLARNLKLHVTAEGVETDAQLRLLK
ncbi:MAG: EAL domain-containing protein, partial [Acidobacteria bacterium]|nr:EAL domain-containing protein [Acidobacteriota bacterium]